MDLYIRTQENGLSKIVDILPVNDNQIIGYSISGRCMVLGKYKTQEEALDVLDEIDWFKEQMIMYEHQTDEYKERIRLFLENKGHTLGTFYMPKE